MDSRLPSGFLFEIRDLDNSVKGYLFGADHRANERMLLSLKNEKIQTAFKNSVKLFVENVQKYQNGLGDTEGPSFQAKIFSLCHSDSDFTKITNMTGGPLDSKLGITKPGVDFHLLAEALEFEKPVDDMEGPDDSNQNLGLLDGKLLENYRNNLIKLQSKALDELLKYSGIPVAEALSEETLVLKRNKAWDKGNIEKFTSAMATLGQQFDKPFVEANELFDEFTKNIVGQSYEDYEIALCEFIRNKKKLNLSQDISKDLNVIKNAILKAEKAAELDSGCDWMGIVHENIKKNSSSDAVDVISLFEYFDKLKAIAFQRNREINLINKVDQVLRQSISNPDFFLFGISHLVNDHNFNFRSLLKEKGWNIIQIK